MNVRVKINPRGARALLTSDAVAAHLDARAERIAAAAGEGFAVRQRPDRVRRVRDQLQLSSHHRLNNFYLPVFQVVFAYRIIKGPL